MVTQQILVLSFWVRIPAAQPEKGDPQRGSPFFDGLCCGNGGVFLLSFCFLSCPSRLPTLLSRPFCRRAFCLALCRSTSFLPEPPADLQPTLLSRLFCRRAFCRALCRSTPFLQEPPADPLPTLLSRPFCRRTFCRTLCRNTSCVPELPSGAAFRSSRPTCCRPFSDGRPAADKFPIGRFRQPVPSTVSVNLYR